MAHLVSRAKGYVALKGTVQVLALLCSELGVRVFTKQIQELCRAATQEADPERLLSLVDQLNKALANASDAPPEEASNDATGENEPGRKSTVVGNNSRNDFA